MPKTYQVVNLNVKAPPQKGQNDRQFTVGMRIEH